MGKDSGGTFEIWPTGKEFGLPKNKKEKLVMEPFTKKVFQKYWEMTMGQDYDQLEGIVLVEVEKEGKREVSLYENYEEGYLLTEGKGYLMRWRESENGWRYNTDRPLKINQSSRVGMRTDLKSGKSKLVVENKIREEGKWIKVIHTFTH